MPATNPEAYVRTSRWTKACPGWRGDLAAYLVGALDRHACAAVRRHLGTCPACEAEYEDLVPVVSWLALLTPPAPAASGEARKARAATTPWRQAPPGRGV
jgi:anti-sigma factor RsiW